MRVTWGRFIQLKGVELGAAFARVEAHVGRLARRTLRKTAEGDQKKTARRGIANTVNRGAPRAVSAASRAAITQRWVTA